MDEGTDSPSPSRSTTNNITVIGNDSLNSDSPMAQTIISSLVSRHSRSGASRPTRSRHSMPVISEHVEVNGSVGDAEGRKQLQHRMNHTNSVAAYSYDPSYSSPSPNSQLLSSSTY